MTSGWILSLWVGLGGFAGSLARYGLSTASQRWPVGWPVGTLTANALGCFLVGVIAGLSDRGGIPPAARLALATGFCGGFTTMSSMIYETAAMLRTGELLHASLYAVGTFVLSLSAFVAGIAAVRALARIGGGPWS